MSGCPDILSFKKLNKKEAFDFSKANFGTESYQKELNDFLAKESEEFLAEEKGDIWGYFNQGGALIGFGAIGLDDWVFEGESATQIVVIHAIAMESEFHGMPKIENKLCKYSSQIMNHLIRDANSRKGKCELVGLLVHPKNDRAKSLYIKFGFEEIDMNYEDPKTKQRYYRYIMGL